MSREGSAQEAPWGNRLVLFHPGTPRSIKRRRLTFVLVAALCGAGVVWPIYPLVAGSSPRLFGLPMPLAWLVVCLAVIFTALVWLFRHESERDDTASGPGGR